jgi:AraC-like DNA-binding protein
MTTGAVYEGETGLRAYREASAETCAISALDDPESFRAQCRTYHLGTALLVDVHSSSLRYLRSARHIARGAYDHYQIAFNLSGHLRYRSGRLSAIVRPGDIAIVDSARETDAYFHAPDQGSAHALVLFVPRAALALLRRAPGSGHLLLLSREQASARSLHDRLSQLLETIQLETPAQVHALAQDLIGLVARSFGSRGELSSGRREVTHRSAADSLERLIERRLNSPELRLELLCAHSGCSRATVYRLLEGEGGPIRYIRQRRLQRAFQELISGSVPHGRILALALRHRFASEATFNRAFRRTFGIPPGEVREIAARSRRAALAGGAAGIGGDGARAIDWIRALAHRA